MTYYIIYFTEKKMYLRSSKLLIHSEEGAKEIFLRLHSPPSRQKQQLFGRAV